MWKPKVNCCVYKIPPLDPALSYIITVLTLNPNFSETQRNVSFHQRLGLASGIFLSGFLAEISFRSIICLLSGTFPAHLIPLIFVTVLISPVRWDTKFCTSWSCRLVYPFLLLLYDMDVSCHRPFLPGTSLEPAVIPTTQASSFTLQYFPYYVWCSKYSCLL